jgi:hypothetical protein
MSKFRQLLNEISSVLHAAYPSVKTARLYGKALKLRHHGRNEEAFKLTARALDCLPLPGKSGSELTLAQRLVVTVLHAELAAGLGCEGIADDAIRIAIEAGRRSEDDPGVQPQLDWLRGRLGPNRTLKR